MIRSICILLIFLPGILASSHAVAQFTKHKSINLKQKVHSASVDRPGELYLLFKDGLIERLDVDGIVQASGKPVFFPTLFDPRDGSKLFGYSSSTGQYQFFSPSFDTNGPPARIDSAYAIQPFLVCPSGDYSLNIIDSADWSMKNINLKTGRLSYESVMADSSLTGPYSYMREYQNFIFILEQGKGIHIYNKMGQRLRTVAGVGIKYFNFLGEELYFLEKDTLRFLDLFNGEERKVLLPYAPEFGLLTDERLYLVKDLGVEIFFVGDR